MTRLIHYFLIIVFMGISEFVLAWGQTGHRVTAEIAERHLCRKTQREIRKLIGKQSIAYWADWADFIKSDPEMNSATGSWHYNNFPGGLDRNGFNIKLATSSDENLYKRTQILIEELKDRRNHTAEENRRNLYFLIHLIGDAHQPLHMGREEDLGGNKIRVKWFNSNTNLHSVWDTKIVDYQKYSYTEYAAILDFHKRKYNKELASGSLADWLWDSYQCAEKIYAGAREDENLWFRYDYENREMLQDQLLKGGLRLAKVLDEIFAQ